MGRAIFAVWLGSILSLGCGGSQKPADNTEVTVEVIEDDDALRRDLEPETAKVDRLGALYLTLAARVESAGPDCEAVARAIERWVAGSRGEVLSLQAELARLPPQVQEDLAPRLEARLRFAAEKVRDGHRRCAEDERVFDAISATNLRL